MRPGRSIAVLAALILAATVTDCRDDRGVTGQVHDRTVTIATVEPGSGFADLEPLRALIGDAQVVALGESRHDLHEQFRFKHRLVEFLVEELGFTVLILEEGLPYSRLIDAYVQGADDDPGALLDGMGYWDIWDTEEMFDLVQWARRRNGNAEGKLRIYGMDVMHPGRGLQEALAYAGDGFIPERLRAGLYDDLSWATTFERYAALSAEDRARLAAEYDRLIGHLERHRDETSARTSAAEFRWALRQAEVARAGHAVFASESRLTGGLLRDRAMADNVQWILEHEAPGERAIVWAANVHVARDRFTMPDAFAEEIEGTGYHLARALGDSLVVLGATFGEGEVRGPGPGQTSALREAGPDYVDGWLSAIGPDRLVLDLRTADGEAPVAPWAGQSLRMRSQHVDMQCVPGDSYDALFFVRDVTPCRPRPVAAERFAELARGHR